jgi:hypothetical protein
MKNKKIIGAAAMSLVMGSSVVYANAADNMAGRAGHAPGVTREYMQAERQALEGGDFAAWKAAVEAAGSTRILEKINESNFSRYAQAFHLRESGNEEGARAILDELGLGDYGRGPLRKGVGLSPEDQAGLEQALVNADYEAWKASMEKGANEEARQFISEEDFNVLVRAYKLEVSGDRAGARDLLDEAELPAYLLRGAKMHKGVSGEDSEASAALTAAYQSGDYETWRALISSRGGGKILEIVNAGNFADFAQAKLLQMQGKGEEARDILKKLGFPFQERAFWPAGKRPVAAAASL